MDDVPWKDKMYFYRKVKERSAAEKEGILFFSWIPLLTFLTLTEHY